MRAARRKLEIGRKHALEVALRRQIRQVLVELEIVTGDRDHRGGHRLVDIARRHCRAKAFLGRARAQEDDPQRLLIGGRRTHLRKLKRLAQQRFGDRAVEEGVVSARVVEQLGQRRPSKGRMPGYAFCID